MSATLLTQPFLDDLTFGEGPRWHDGRLWFSDFYDEAVYSAGPGGDRRLEVRVPGRPSGLGWLPDGRLLVVSMLERAVKRLEPDGTLVHHGDLTPWATFHGNDMVVAADGRAYAGNFGFDLEAAAKGEGSYCTTSIVRVDPDGTSHEAAADLAFPNGTVIFPDGKTLVVGESAGARLTAFDLADDGSLSGRRVWAELEGCAPDGICLDAEGCIWVANALATECRRVAQGGEVLERVETTEFCYACALGGDDRRSLFCVTAPGSLETEVMGRRSGRIEQVVVSTPGAGLP